MNSSADESTMVPSPGLELVLCADWESLVRDLAGELAEPPADPFASRLVVLDAPAARRDLSQQLAVRGGGICAGVDFAGLRQVRRRLEEGLLGIDAGTDQWRPRGLALAVLDVMDASVDEPWFVPIAEHLGVSVGSPGQVVAPRPGRRLATADRISRLLLRYSWQLPSLLRRWSTGELVGPDGGPLAESAHWQPMIWRRVRDLLDQPDPVSRHDELCRLLATDGPTGLDDPVLRVVNPASCDPLDRELVVALARRMPVVVRQHVAAPDSTLVKQWGRATTTAVERWTAVASRVRRVGSTLQGEPLPARVQVHASHGPDRQVEVLREVLCGLLEEDPGLEPRHVVVACTDLDTYAPLVRAAFCLAPDLLGRSLHPGHRLRVQIADGSLTQPNQVLETLRLLLHLAGDRASAQDLVELCGSAPVRARFDLADDDLDRIQRLVSQAGVRWGLDGRHRAEFGLGQVRQSTWLAGVERILTGIAMGPQPLHWLGTALPVEQVDSTDVMAAGMLAEVVSRTRKLVADWRVPAPIPEWVGRLHEALDLLTATQTDDAWQLTRARSELADLADLTVERTAPLGLGDVQALFDKLLRTGTGRPNFGNGSLLVCGLDDLGGVPHPVVAVLGLDDQRFPARPGLDGDDLTLWGEPDPELDPRSRSRDRLLDAVAAASEQLVVVHQGFTPRTNEPVPRPVSVVDLAAACSPGQLTVNQHTLQPQSAVNFHGAGTEPPFSFDTAALAGAQARELLLDQPPAPQPALWQVRLGSAGTDSAAEPLDISALLVFYRNPAAELLRRRIGVTMTQWSDSLEDELPIDPRGLQDWNLGDRMVRLALDGLDPAQVAAAERLRGDLPPGQLGTRTLDRLMPAVTKVVNSAMRERQAPAQDVDCQLDLPSGQLLTGRVRVHEASIVSHAFSRTSAVHLLQAWFDLLLLSATRPAPAVGWRAVHIGRDAIAILTAPPQPWCVETLDQLIAVRSAGLERLVPLPVKAASIFHRVTPLRPFPNHDPEAQAAREFRFEHDADWARFVTDDLDALRRIPGEPSDPGLPGPSRFENLSDWLFAPLREHLSVGNLR